MEYTVEALILMSRAGHAMSDAMARAVGDREIITNPSVLTLLVLFRDGPQRPSQIADLNSLTSGGATKLITRLERAGLVERATGAVKMDGRAVVVSLTEQGTRTAEAVATATASQVEAFIDDLVALRSGT